MRYARKDMTVGPTECRTFDSIGDMIATLRATDAQRFEGHDYTGKNSSPRWVGRGFANHEALYAALNEAWESGIGTMERMVKELADADLPKPTSRRRKARFSECDGDELDYDRLRSGRDYWRTSRRQNTKGPATITLIVDVAANAHVDHEDILWRGAAAVALTKLLEEAGYRVELWATSFTDGNYHSRRQRCSCPRVGAAQGVLGADGCEFAHQCGVRLGLPNPVVPSLLPGHPQDRQWLGPRGCPACRVARRDQP